MQTTRKSHKTELKWLVTAATELCIPTFHYDCFHV